MKNKRKGLLILLTIALIVVSLLAIFSNKADNLIQTYLAQSGVVCKQNNLMVHYIDVGQGDAIAINLPDGKTMLIDSGPNSSWINYLNEKVLSNNKLDYFVLTHTDADHVGGALNVLKSCQIGTVFLPVYVPTNPSNTYKKIVDYIESNSINNKTGYESLNIEENGYKIKVFGPLVFNDKNNGCPVIKIEYMGYSYLFTGDIEAVAEALFVDEYGSQLDSDVLKVAHHGSKGSSTQEFLQLVTPNYSVISVGEGNTYNHPHKEAVDRLNATNSTILRTDKLGTIVFLTSKNYNLTYLTGDFRTINFEIKFVYVVIVVDAIILVAIIGVLVANPKQKKKQTKTKK